MHKNSELTHKHRTPIRWLQPESLDDRFPHLIGNHRWSINYPNIEKTLWQSKLSASNQWRVDSDTADLLETITAELPASIKFKELQRIKFLIEKSIPNSRGRKVAKLVVCYFRYQQEYQAILSKISNSKGERKLSLLRASQESNRRLQERYFGIALARVLFDRKNITTNYITDRRIVNLNENLSKEEKRALLLALRESYAKYFSVQ